MLFLYSHLDAPKTFVIVSLLIILISWYVKLLWGRRRLYYYGSQIRGPLGLPIIGCFYKFIFSDLTRFLILGMNEILFEIAEQHSGFCALWFGHKLKFVIAIPEYIDTVLSSEAALEKSEEYKCLEPAVGKGLFTASVDHWRGQRKLIGNFLSRQNLKTYLKSSTKYTELTMCRWKEKLSNGEEVDIKADLISSTVDLLFECVGGDRPDYVTSLYNTNIQERIMEGLFQRISYLPYRNYYLFSLSKIGKATLNLINPYKDIARTLLQSRKDEVYQNDKTIALSKDRFILIDYLLASLHHIQEDIRDKIILDELATFVTSSDTASVTTCYVLLSLGIQREIQNKVYQEVIDVFGKSGPIDWDKIIDLKYLDLVLKESLRLFPVTPSIGRKFLEDIKLHDGTILPKDSSAVIPLLHIHRSKKFWPEPLKFDPERFLPENMAKRHRCTYLPFSYGPRNCVGIIYGQMTVKSIVAHIVRDFYITSDYKSIEEVELIEGILLKPKNGLNIHVNIRK